MLFALALSPAAVKVSAEEKETDEDFAVESCIYVNPVYTDVVSENDLIAPSADIKIQEASVQKLAATDTTYYASLEEAGAALREAMIDRRESIVINVDIASEGFSDMSISDICYGIIDEAMEECSDPRGGDYLRYQYAGCSISVSYNSDIAAITYTPTYYTTREQEETMDSLVGSVISSLGIEEKDTDYKIARIYDYITANVSYDYTNLNDSSYLLKYTAYAALVNGTAVCQGYSCLFYRLCREAGVSARIISGTGNGENHAWNIAGIDGLYYNLDATWDAGLSASSYQYFLRCDANFADHQRGSSGDIDYTSTAFYTAYPMSDSDYGYPESALIAVTGISLNATEATIGYGESFTVTAEVLPNDASDRTVTFSYPYYTIPFSVSYNTALGYLTVTPDGTSGEIDVMVTTNDGGYSETCKIYVTDTYSIAGTVTGYAGDGSVILELCQDGETIDTVAASDGAYEFEKVTDGDYTISVSADGDYVTHEYSITVDSADLTQDVAIYQLGDVNMDGSRSAADVTRIGRHVAKLVLITDEYELLLADVTGDASVTAADVTRLGRFVAKLINTL